MKYSDSRLLWLLLWLGTPGQNDKQDEVEVSSARRKKKEKRLLILNFLLFYFFHLFTFYHRSKSWTAITLHFIRPWIPKCTLFMWKSKWLYQSEKRNKQWKSKIIHFLNKAKDCNASKPVSGFSSKLCTAFYFGKLFEN